jgi:hypothetical protein
MIYHLDGKNINVEMMSSFLSSIDKNKMFVSEMKMFAVELKMLVFETKISALKMKMPLVGLNIMVIQIKKL